MNDSYLHKGLRKKLIDTLKAKGINSIFVLQAIDQVPRHVFMDSSFVNFSYRDQAFPIDAGQTISQPYTVAFQTQLLDVQKHDKILEVGTGSGYHAAVLIEMGANVFTIERKRVLYIKSHQLLKELGYKAHFFYGDGYEGLPSYAPFDKILVTAGASKIPENLLKQLKVGGRLIAPIGSSSSQIMTMVIRKTENDYTYSEHGHFIFVPLLKGIS
jgi:protein-L-isoaspartate(D-aspartate) O-methyltransferase